MRSFGQLCLLLAFVGTGYAAFATYLGARRVQPRIRTSGLVAGLASAVALTLVVAALAHALLTKDFRFDYVVRYTSQSLPWHYALSSLWVGQAGSLLLWTWLTIALSVLFLISAPRDATIVELRDSAFSVLMAFCCFLTTIMVFAVDPMAASIVRPDDGAGLSPILQHPAMLIHPPIVFFAYAAWTIPFALATAALLTGRLGVTWTKVARPWALIAWCILGSGILLGAAWAYSELGWGGYWAWDPVENGSLIPWLLGTAALHTLMTWRYRGMLKKSALALVMATFGMCNFATFLTRSGIFSSLHAFSQSPIGWSFLFLMLTVGLLGTVLIWRHRGQLRPTQRIPSVWCRESMIVISTLALTTLAGVICLGTISAAVSDVVLGRKIIFGLAFYNNALIPVGLLVLSATAAAPLLRWGDVPSPAERRLLLLALGIGLAVAILAKLSGTSHPIWLAVYGLTGFALATFLFRVSQDARRFRTALLPSVYKAAQVHRRVYAGFVIHLGVFCLAIGIAGSSLGTQRRDLTLSPGESIRWAGRSIEFLKVIQRDQPDKLIVEALLRVQRGSARSVMLTPAQHFHYHAQEWTTETSVAASWSGDFYTILHSGQDDGSVRLTFVDNPLMRWIWVGGGVMVLGGLAAVWPRRTSRAASQDAARRSTSKDRPRHAHSRAASIAVLVATVWTSTNTMAGEPSSDPRHLHRAIQAKETCRLETQ